MEIPRPIPAADQQASPSREVAIRLARRHFIAGRRIEMGPLADELGVSRVTLNRWVGSRDKLLGEVNWSLAEISLRDARAQAGGSGADAVADTVEVFARAVLAADFMQAFLNRETDIALRILTTSHSDLQENVIGFIEQLLREELNSPPASLDFADLAYLVVRISESFIYVDMITGGQPDPAKIGHAVRALLS